MKPIAATWFCPTCEWSATSVRARSCPRCDVPMAVDPMADWSDVESGMDVTHHPFHQQGVHNMALDCEATEPRWFWWPYPDSATSIGSYWDVNVGYIEPAPPLRLTPLSFAGIPIVFSDDCAPGTMFAVAPARESMNASQADLAKRWKDAFYDIPAREPATYKGVPMPMDRLDQPTLRERVDLKLGGVSDAQYERYKAELRSIEQRLARTMGLDRYKLFEGDVPGDFRSPNEPKHTRAFRGRPVVIDDKVWRGQLEVTRDEHGCKAFAMSEGTWGDLVSHWNTPDSPSPLSPLEATKGDQWALPGL